MEFAGRGQEYLARIMLARKTSLTIQSIDRDVSAIHLSIIENARAKNLSEIADLPESSVLWMRIPGSAPKRSISCRIAGI